MNAPVTGTLDEIATGVLNDLFEGCQVIGFDWTYLFVNDALVRQGKLPREQLVGRTMMACYPGIEHTTMFAALRECMEGRAPHVMQNEFVRLDGSVGFFELRFMPVPMGVCILSLDVTDNKVAERKRVESEDMFRELFRASPDGIILVSHEGEILLSNAEADRIFGYDGDGLAGRSVDDLLPAALRSAHAGLRHSYAASPAKRAMGQGRELRGRRRDGSEFPVSVSLGAFSFRGRPSVLSVVRDISARRSLEDQLRQVQKMEAVGRLAAGIAHDFNNMLSVILSYASLASDNLPVGDPLRDDLREIEMAGQRASELTGQLLAFGRKQPLQPRVIDLNAILARVGNMLGRLLGEQIEMRTIAAVPLWSVKADPSQIEQVIMNLAVNARDAMPAGGKLTIETANVQLDQSYVSTHLGTRVGPHVMLAVSDTGVGIDRALHDRIFEPFFTTKEVGKGTGLGLATVFGIVQQSGGSIWLYSELGQGTTFKVYLPRVEHVDAPAPVEVVTVSGVRASETILLVEDEDQVRQVTEQILRRNGYRVLTAESPAEALVVSGQYQGRIHLLLTDVVMPGMNGRQLAGELAPSRPGMRVLFMSGYTDNAIVHHGILDEGVSFLQKPLRPDVLLRKVRELLDAAPHG